jgi:hypothetical protein
MNIVFGNINDIIIGPLTLPISDYTHPHLPKKSERRTRLKSPKKATLWQIFAQKRDKKGGFGAFVGALASDFGLYPPTCEKEAVFASDFGLYPPTFEVVKR